MAMTELNFSARAYDKILKVFKDDCGFGGVGANQDRASFKEAIQYRSLDRQW